jgi:hypothetical protein
MTAFSNEARRAGAMGILTLLTLTSCGGPPNEFAEVEGKVTLKGKPLAGAMVRFYPLGDEKKQLPYATGMTDGAGFFSLTHGDDEPGALVGSNRVVVSWPSRDMRGALPAPSQPIPLRYTVADMSPLTVEVKSGGPQTINLLLGD